MSKLLKFGADARNSLLVGVKTLSEAVGSTLGPLGNNVAMEIKWRSPLVVHDGVTVAKEVDLDDPFENLGARLVQDAASNTGDQAGDGTTTSTVLAHAIIEEAFNRIASGEKV